MIPFCLRVRQTGCNSNRLCFLSHCCVWRLSSAGGVELVAWAIVVSHFGMGGGGQCFDLLVFFFFFFKTTVPIIFP